MERRDKNISKIESNARKYLDNASKYRSLADKNMYVGPAGNLIHINTAQMQKLYKKGMKYANKGNKLLSNYTKKTGDKYNVKEAIENGKAYVDIMVNGKVRSRVE